jgi:hypothetical protein
MNFNLSQKEMRINLIIILFALVLGSCNKPKDQLTNKISAIQSWQSERFRMLEGGINYCKSGLEEMRHNPRIDIEKFENDLIFLEQSLAKYRTTEDSISSIHGETDMFSVEELILIDSLQDFMFNRLNKLVLKVATSADNGIILFDSLTIYSATEINLKKVNGGYVISNDSLLHQAFGDELSNKSFINQVDSLAKLNGGIKGVSIQQD